MLTALLVFLLIKTVTYDFQFIKLQKAPFENLRLVNHISQTIINEIKDPRTFGVKSYVLDNTIFEYPILDTILLIPLEDKLNQKLAKVSDKSPYNHVQVGGNKYFVIACHKFSNKFSDEDCLKEFSLQYSNYGILKNLHTGSPISIYIAKHE